MTDCATVNMRKRNFNNLILEPRTEKFVKNLLIPNIVPDRRGNESIHIIIYFMIYLYGELESFPITIILSLLLNMQNTSITHYWKV